MSWMRRAMVGGTWQEMVTRSPEAELAGTVNSPLFPSTNFPVAESRNFPVAESRLELDIGPDLPCSRVDNSLRTCYGDG
jgi:hypothetical protein